jgi:hypothetical protein
LTILTPNGGFLQSNVEQVIAVLVVNVNILMLELEDVV